MSDYDYDPGIRVKSNILQCQVLYYCYVFDCCNYYHKLNSWSTTVCIICSSLSADAACGLLQKSCTAKLRVVETGCEGTSAVKGYAA